MIKLSGLKQHKQLCYIIKQQISREIMISKVKSIDRGKHQGQASEHAAITNSTSTPAAPDTPKQAPSTPTVLRSLNVRELNKNKMQEQLNKDGVKSSVVIKKPAKVQTLIYPFFKFK